MVHASAQMKRNDLSSVQLLVDLKYSLKKDIKKINFSADNFTFSQILDCLSYNSLRFLSNFVLDQF